MKTTNKDNKSSCPHRVGIYGRDFRKSVIDKHVSIGVDRCSSGVLVKNRFSWVHNDLHVPKPPLHLTMFSRHNDCYIPWANEGTPRLAGDVA